MEIKKAVVFEAEEPLSKAISHLRKSPAVLVSYDGEYFGMIDHRSLTNRVQDPSKTKCGNFAIRPPVLTPDSSWRERLNAFLVGHFKALPVVDGSNKPLGITTRVETLKDLKEAGMLPHLKASDIMNSPVYTIEENKTIADLKKAFKEKNAHRMLITSKGRPAGIVCTYDIGFWLLKPGFSGGKKDFSWGSKMDIDDYPLRDVLRPNIAFIHEGATLEEVVDRMIEEEQSFVIVVDKDENPVGVISALDIFKKISEKLAEKVEVFISGLKDESVFEYDHILSKIGGVLNKFKKAFDIHYATVHVKHTKHAFEVSVHFDTNKGLVHLKGERATLRDTVNELAEEIERVLRKMKR